MHKNTRYTLDVNFFKNINTQKKAYWLGMIAADGHISKNGTLYLNFSEKDLKHLEKFKRHIKTDRPIKTRTKVIGDKTFHSKRITVCSKQFTKNLEDNGIPRGAKSLILKPPILQKDLIRHWIRGYFDGDGSFGLNSERPNFIFGVTGTKTVLEFIRDYFNECLNLNFSHIYHRKKHHEAIYRFQVRGNNQVYLICKEIYRGSTICLNRKHKKFKQLLKLRKTYTDASNKRYNRVN